MGMLADPVYARALDAVHHLDDPDPPWDDVLDGFRDVVGGDSATLIMLDGQDGLLTFQQRGVDPRAQQAYEAHFCSQDITVPISRGAPPGTWFDTAELFSQAALSRNAYYADFMCRYQATQMVTYIVEETPFRRGGLTVQRSRPCAYTRDLRESAPVRRFTTALSRALVRREDASRQWFAHANAALASFDEAVCLVACDGQLIRTPPPAQAMLERGHVLRARNGRLWHPVAWVDAALRAALRRAASDDGPVALDLPGPAGATHRVEFARAPAKLSTGGETLVLARLRLPATPGVDGAQAALRTAFGLTLAEAGVLDGLMQGLSARQYAEGRQVSYHTVRSQIAALMQKTGCSRQVDLVREGLRVTRAGI